MLSALTVSCKSWEMYSCVLFEADSEMEVVHNRSSNTVSQARSGRPAPNYVSPGSSLEMVAYDSGAYSGEKGCLGCDELLYCTHANLSTRVRAKRYLHGHPSDLLVD